MVYETSNKDNFGIDMESSTNDVIVANSAQVVKPFESFKCLDCNAEHSNQKTLDAHLRTVCVEKNVISVLILMGLSKLF